MRFESRPLFRSTARKGYAARELANFHGGLVLVGDHVYGASGDFGPSRWVCLDFKTGKVAWSVEDRKLGTEVRAHSRHYRSTR